MSVSREGALEYWRARINGEAYTDETEDRQNASLLSAQESLAPYLVEMFDEAAVDAAVYEQALWLLGSRAELQSAGVTSFSLGGISESYTVTGRPSGVAPNAWRIIKYGLDGTGGSARGPVWL